MSLPVNPKPNPEGSQGTATRDRLRQSKPGDFIVAFDHPHVLGSICRQPCAQCHETTEKLAVFGWGGKPVQQPPFLIAAIASYEDWKADVLANHPETRTFLEARRNSFFYWIKTD